MTPTRDPKIENEADESQESQSSNDAAIDSFIDGVGLDKIKTFLRDLLLEWESNEAPPESEEQDQTPEPAPQKKTTAFRNGQPVEVGA